MNLDDNIEVTKDGSRRCRHCATTVAAAGESLSVRCLQNRVPLAELGPQVRELPDRYTQVPVSAELTICPSCLTLLAVDAGPTADPARRMHRLDSQPTV